MTERVVMQLTDQEMYDRIKVLNHTFGTCVGDFMSVVLRICVESNSERPCDFSPRPRPMCDSAINTSSQGRFAFVE